MGITTATGMFLALRTPPWAAADARAHTGYLMALSHGHVPTVDTPIEAPDGAINLDLKLALFSPVFPDGSQPHAAVWVANHPPGAYLPAVPGAWWARSAGHGNEVLLWQRMANVLGGALTVGFTALLARELSGRADVAVVAAGLVALAPFLAGSTSTGLTDGMGLAASVAVLWATARALRHDFARGSVWPVALTASVCGLVRISALAVAIAVVGVGLLLAARRARAWPWRATGCISAAVLVPSGWFYLRNILLYGDPAASGELLDRFDRSGSGSWIETILSPRLWDDVVTKVLTTYANRPVIAGRQRVPAPEPAATIALVVVAVAAVAVVVALVRHARRGPGEEHAPGRRGPNPGGWVLLIVALSVTLATTARHVSGGGFPHARYLLLVIPAAACVVAWAVCLPRSRGVVGWLVVSAPLVALLVLDGFRLPAVIPRGAADPGPFDARLAGPLAQAIALAAGGVALACYVVATIVVLRRDRPVAPSRPRDHDVRSPAIG